MPNLTDFELYDLHSHVLFGVDDGADSLETSLAMLEMAYGDGIRGICCTPHFSPYLYGDTSENSKIAFEQLKEAEAKIHPDLKLFLGHELGCHDGALESVQSGHCRTLNGSRYLLVDFPEDIDFFELSTFLSRMQSSGKCLVLAHAERYRCLHGKLNYLFDFADSGGLIQVNASSVNSDWGFGAKMQWKRLVKEGLVAVIASDGHNLTNRKPLLSVCFPYLQKHVPPEAMKMMLSVIPQKILANEPIERF